MLCLQTGTVMSDPNRMKYHSDQFYMKSGAEMQELFRDCPQALANTVAIAERFIRDLLASPRESWPTASGRRLPIRISAPWDWDRVFGDQAEGMLSLARGLEASAIDDPARQDTG